MLHTSNLFQITAAEIFHRTMRKLKLHTRILGCSSTKPKDIFPAILDDDTAAKKSRWGTAVISLNGKWIIICHALHVSFMKTPLYYLTRHCLQPGCGIYVNQKQEMMILFPEFIIQDDKPVDHTVSYQPIVRSLKNQQLAYVEPRARNARVIPPTIVPNIIDDDTDAAGVLPEEPVPVPVPGTRI